MWWRQVGAGENRAGENRAGENRAGENRGTETDRRDEAQRRAQRARNACERDRRERPSSAARKTERKVGATGPRAVRRHLADRARSRCRLQRRLSLQGQWHVRVARRPKRVQGGPQG